MPAIQSPPSERLLAAASSIERPPCPKCRTGMERVDMIPGLGQLAHRIFRCGKCRHNQIMSQVKSEMVNFDQRDRRESGPL